MPPAAPAGGVEPWPRPYVLSLGTLEPRKNLDVLLDAFERLIAAGPPDLDLVLAGRTGWSVASLERRLRSPRLAGRVHRLGYVDDADLPDYYLDYLAEIGLA